MPSTSGHARTCLRERLEARRAEIEQAALTRVRAIADPAEVSDPAYAEGLRAAVEAAVAYGIQTTGHEGADPPIPVALLAQARMAARADIPLGTVQRRYFAGYSLLGYFVLEEAGDLVDGPGLQRLLGAHAGLFDRLLAAIGEEHARETAAMRRAPERGHAERIERLLAGEMVDTSEIAYDLDGRHLGLTLAGPREPGPRLRALAAELDCRLLALPREDGSAWAWLGARRRLDSAEALQAVSRLLPDCACALGEPGEGVVGWRLTHRQALAALAVAQAGRAPHVRYADVVLLAATLHDDLLATSLRQLYLAPLHRERDEGLIARATLKTYFEADRNVNATAAALGVKRHTVTRRLRAVEGAIGRPITSCAGEIEAALGLDDLGVRDVANRR